MRPGPVGTGPASTQQVPGLAGSAGSPVFVPLDVGPLDPVPVQPGATSVSDALRGGAAAVSGSLEVTRATGMPAEWSGLAADAAGSAFTWFTREGDAAVAAFETALVGLDRYLARMGRARARHDDLTQAREALNADLATLRGLVPTLIGTAAGARARAVAEHLARRRARLVGEIATLVGDIVRYQAEVIAALDSVDSEQEARRAAQDPGRTDVGGLQAHLRSIRDSPHALRRLWSGLSAAQREALIAVGPGLIGTTSGLPVRARDDANRAALRRDLAGLRGLQTQGVRLTAAQQRQLANAAATAATLAREPLALDPHTGRGLGTYLLDYDPSAFDGDGRCVIAFGDPDTADRTAVMVPGLGNDMSSMPSLAQDGLHVEQQAQVDAPGQHISTVVWMGYDAPDLDSSLSSDLRHDDLDAGGVLTEAKAATGGHELVAFVGGLRATHHGVPTDLTVIGHSYGSTTAAHAATDGMRADNLVLVGSPGAGDGVEDVAGLHLTPGHVYVGTADNDPVTWLGGDGRVGLGEDPSQASFGATRFSVAAGPTFHPEDVAVGFRTHTSYFDPASTSLANIGDIVDGRPPVVVPGRGESAHAHLEHWLLSQSGYEARHRLLGPVVHTGEHVGGGVVRGLESGLGELGGLVS